MYDSCVESEKGVPVEVQRWRVRCLALFNIKKSSLTLKHQKVKSKSEPEKKTILMGHKISSFYAPPIRSSFTYFILIKSTFYIP